MDYQDEFLLDDDLDKFISQDEGEPENSDDEEVEEDEEEELLE